MFKKILVLFFIGILSVATEVQAREPYHATVAIDDQSASVSAPNLVDLKKDLKEALFSLTPPTEPLVPASLDFNIRGIIAIGSFANQSTALVVNVPQTNTTKIFDGGTREASLILFRDYIRNGGRHHGLLKAYARFSPIDPIAGNPNSLLAQMAQADYLAGRLSPFSGCDCCWSSQPIVHQFQLGSSYGRAFSNGFDTTIFTMPLRYSYSPNLDWAIILDAPFSYIRNGGASSLFGSLGLGLRIPLITGWSITSMLRYGAGGTLDLCTSGSFASAGLTSVYNYKICDYVLSMTNYAGYFFTPNLWMTGVNFNYNLHNWVFNNGLTLSSCEGYTICNRTVNFNLTFVDSSFARERLYIKHYDEIGIALITTHVNPCLEYDCLSLGFSYQFGQRSYKGFFGNLVYQF